jgi:hypothetical protein
MVLHVKWARWSEVGQIFDALIRSRGVQHYGRKGNTSASIEVGFRFCILELCARLVVPIIINMGVRPQLEKKVSCIDWGILSNPFSLRGKTYYKEGQWIPESDYCG